MRILYVDCSAGVSGDMLYRAVVDLGFPARKMKIGKLSLRTCLPRRARRRQACLPRRARRRQAFLPCRAGELFRFIRGCSLSQPLESMILRVFRKIFWAEGKAHGEPQHSVQLHQLKGMDTLVNIAGFCSGLIYFKVDRLYCSPVPLGWKHHDHTGRVRHFPGPATRRLLSGLPIQERRIPFEWTTPTGAALLSSFARRGALPPLRILKIGEGIGTRQPPGEKSALQLILGEPLATST